MNFQFYILTALLIQMTKEIYKKIKIDYKIKMSLLL